MPLAPVAPSQNQMQSFAPAPQIDNSMMMSQLLQNPEAAQNVATMLQQMMNSPVMPQQHQPQRTMLQTKKEIRDLVVNSNPMGSGMPQPWMTQHFQ